MSNHDKICMDEFIDWVKSRNPNQPEFIQAVHDLACDIYSLYVKNEEWQQLKVLERLTEPDRIITFRICWEDDTGKVHINRGWRVQHSGVIGPYKGGIRFHPTVNESVLKFLAFEQTFKNALTSLPIGGGKGGSDFDPRHRSDREIMRFCQAFMNELYRHIGENTDVPAGDINVGRREIGYLFGQYRRLANTFSGALTGKDIEFGGSHVRMEATGYGLVYFLRCMLGNQDESLKGKRVAISGAGNVALHAAQKAIELGATVITLSSSKGTLYNEQGIPATQVDTAIEKRAGSTEILKAILDASGGSWREDCKPWQYPCDIALPCATQNELDLQDAQSLVDNGTRFVAEGANMPCTTDAVQTLHDNRVIHAPGKASNAGGVALSGLEMAQNASFSRWQEDRLDQDLLAIMQDIHRQCIENAEEKNGYINYHQGANVAAFKRVAKALVAQGIG